MEYMASGGPAIATFASGHQDILSDENSLPLGDDPPKVWHDADLEEIVEKLEWAYQNRQKLAELGARAAKDVTRFERRG